MAASRRRQSRLHSHEELSVDILHLSHRVLRTAYEWLAQSRLQGLTQAGLIKLDIYGWFERELLRGAGARTGAGCSGTQQCVPGRG